MKRKLIISIFIVISFLIYSCSKDYLETSPTEFLTQDQVAEAAALNPAVIAGSMSGVYTMMFQTFTGGTTGHDDFGIKGYDIYSDFLSGDLALTISTYGWYRSITEFQTTTDYTFLDNYQVWRYFYRIIRSCNLIIDALGGNDAVPTLAANKWIMGQAKAMRANSYFYLAQYFSNTYDPAKEILPIYTSPDDQNGPKVTTQVIYDLIIKDLTDAITLLDGFNRTAKHQVNKPVAQGMLAYVYGAMGKNQEAKVLTNDIITANQFPLTTSAQAIGGFNNVNTPSWMWGVDITLDNGLDLVSWWGQMDAYTYSYQWAGDRKAIDRNLYNKIPANDVRKGQFWPTTTSSYFLTPRGKFYHPGLVIGGQRNIETDYIYMRVDEMYLLNAEAAAKSGDEPMARTRLKDLLSLRIPDASYVDALSGQALLDEIYLQTRIELWGEGKSYLAMKRNKATIVRGPNHLSFVGVPISYDDDRLTFEIPQAEIQNNPFIDK